MHLVSYQHQEKEGQNTSNFMEIGNFMKSNNANKWMRVPDHDPCGVHIY